MASNIYFCIQVTFKFRLYFTQIKSSVKVVFFILIFTKRILLIHFFFYYLQEDVTNLKVYRHISDRSTTFMYLFSIDFISTFVYIFFVSLNLNENNKNVLFNLPNYKDLMYKSIFPTVFISAIQFQKVNNTTSFNENLHLAAHRFSQ